jgi:DNA-binding MarR family transcriptional regulator
LFLLAQVGAHVAQRFAQRLTPLGLTPPHSGILRALAESAGISQQQLATQLGVHPSRLVALVDDLEARGLAERRQSPDDRRTHALQLTDAGRKLLGEIARTALKLQSEVCASLDSAERDLLATLLGRIADEQGLIPGVHPGLGRAPRRDER